MIITLTDFLKKIDKNVLTNVEEYVFKSPKIHGIEIFIKDINLKTANVNTLLDCIDKNELAALIIQLLEQASKKMLSIKLDNSIDNLLKNVFTGRDKKLRELISNYYDKNKIKDINEITDEVNDSNDAVIDSSFNYFIIYNDKLIQKKNEGDINELIKEKELTAYIRGKHFSSGIYLIEEEKELNGINEIKKNDSQYKKIYRINNINDDKMNVTRLAKRIDI